MSNLKYRPALGASADVAQLPSGRVAVWRYPNNVWHVVVQLRDRTETFRFLEEGKAERLARTFDEAIRQAEQRGVEQSAERSLPQRRPVLPPGVSVCREEDTRTVAEVLAARAFPGGGCCNRYCDMSGCDCLENAQRREASRQIHRVALGLRNHSGCSICQDPNCDNPGGKH